MRAAFLVLLVGLVLRGSAVSQTLEDRINAVGNGTVHLSFAARPDVCESGVHSAGSLHSSEDWEPDCGRQLVRVRLRIRHGKPVAVRTYVGGRWRAGSTAHDFGTVRAAEAATYFVELAGQSRAISGDPILPAALADSIAIWPALLRLVRTEHVPHERRRNAIFWVGQAAGAAAARALDSVALDDSGTREIRTHAVFALAQRSADEAVPALIRIARTNRDPELRRTALFWLGQSEDPRALDLFEEILR